MRLRRKIENEILRRKIEKEIERQKKKQREDRRIEKRQKESSQLGEGMTARDEIEDQT